MGDRLAPSSADPLAFLRVRELTWHDLVLPKTTLAELRRLCALAPAGGLVAVVSGPPGVGKTVAVQTCSEQLRLDTWRVDCGLLVERHGEATGDALPDVLAACERPHAVALFHGADWLFEPVAGAAGARLLELARGRRSPTVLETRDEATARALAREDVEHVELPFPDLELRAELWRRLAWRAHPLLELDVAELAAVPAAGAAIEAALERAMEDAGSELPTTQDLLAVLPRRG
jgi:hypothetical protein